MAEVSEAREHHQIGGMLRLDMSHILRTVLMYLKPQLRMMLLLLLLRNQTRQKRQRCQMCQHPLTVSAHTTLIKRGAETLLLKSRASPKASLRERPRASPRASPKTRIPDLEMIRLTQAGRDVTSGNMSEVNRFQANVYNVVAKLLEAYL